VENDSDTEFLFNRLTTADESSRAVLKHELTYLHLRMHAWCACVEMRQGAFNEEAFAEVAKHAGASAKNSNWRVEENLTTVANYNRSENSNRCYSPLGNDEPVHNINYYVSQQRYRRECTGG
jgi:hypothetical protein